MQKGRIASINSDPVFIKMTCVGRFFADVLYQRGGERVSFNNWSVLHGSVLTRATYLEGLELLRQDNTATNSQQFCAKFFHPGSEVAKLPLKEMMWLARNFGGIEFAAQLDKCVDKFSA